MRFVIFDFTYLWIILIQFEFNSHWQSEQASSAERNLAVDS